MNANQPSPASVVAMELAMRGMYVDIPSEPGKLMVDGALCGVVYLPEEASPTQVPTQTIPTFINEECRHFEDIEKGVFPISGFNVSAMEGVPFRYKKSGFESALAWIGMIKDVAEEGRGRVGRLECSWPETIVRGSTLGLAKAGAKALAGNPVSAAIMGAIAQTAASSTPQALLKEEYSKWKIEHDEAWASLCSRISERLRFRITRLEENFIAAASTPFFRLQVQGLLVRSEAMQEAIHAVSKPPEDSSSTAETLNKILEKTNVHQAAYFHELTKLNKLRRAQPEIVDAIKSGLSKAAERLKR